MNRIENVPEPICRRARDLQQNQGKNDFRAGSLAELKHHQSTRLSWNAIFQEVGMYANVSQSAVYWNQKLQGFYTVTSAERAKLAEEKR